ncbi:MAG TPA: HAMP domain-containing sensor histidine kinase [Steroidobacteraceae bacterium]|nr:HAMP domain-containing sensor histidine kinase [Steroidobacteraceae bacterium]
MKSTRIFQLTALLLVVVSVFQVGYWVFAERAYTLAKVHDRETLYHQQLAAARDLLAAGVPAARVTALLPSIRVRDGQPLLGDEVERSLQQEQQRRITQYLWEGGFFLLALCACIAVIWMALGAEAQVLKEQDNFLALVSHQFKTPLASLQLSLETMSLRSLAPEQSRALIERMLGDLTRMETMVSQILDSVRLSRGRVSLKREPVLLASTVGRVTTHFQERAARDHIRIETSVAEGLQVLADPLAVDVVVRNLIENALAAVAPVGGGRVLVSAQRIGNEVQLTVRDSGIGFRPADESRLFEKFSRLNPAGGSSYYGSGLGLYIVKRLMQLLGGRVSAHSEGMGRGAEFVLTWPVAAEPS